MITAELRNRVDKIWGEMWAGGITNPLTVIEQLTYLMFIKSLDDLEIEKEARSVQLKSASIFPAEKKHLRWSYFRYLSPETLYEIVSNEVFPFIRTLNSDQESVYSKFMQDAIFLIPSPLMLQRAVEGISELPLKDRDLKGDIYEYMLSKLQTSGHNGQFRTPRHIIQMIVRLMDPTPEDIICDPACGTAGFLLAASRYLTNNHPEIMEDNHLKEHFHTEMFHGYDTDRTMLRIAAMNMQLHNVEKPNIEYRNALATHNPDREKYSLILANPPFTGTIDSEIIAPDLLSTARTKKTELLFIALFIRMLKVGGRCACIVPEGVLFGSSKAHRDIRKELVENQCLNAVISMPSGVFRPYTSISTAILIFTKTNSGGTKDILFYDMQADGFTLDDKRNVTDKNDIPDIMDKFSNIELYKQEEGSSKSFFVTKQQVVSNNYDLSISKYKPDDRFKEDYGEPEDILKRIKVLENEIMSGIKELEDILK